MTTSKRINILVYTGEGTTSASLQHVFYTFRRLLSPTYVVLPLTTDALLKEPWQSTCAALVMPGGADVPYCRSLNGKGNQRIKQFVQNGGRYIGLCAGGYYGSARCEFMQGHPKMEVVGDRELGFFPGVCRGLAFEGFMYQSEAKARAVRLAVNANLLSSGNDGLNELRSYYHGGGVFVDAPKYRDWGVEVLASYTEPLHCESGEGTAAVVYCKVGDGAALLTGPHPEFASSNIDKNRHGPDFQATVEAIEADEENRTSFLKACLNKLGLKVNTIYNNVPSPSPLHLTSNDPSQVSILSRSWKDILIKTHDGRMIIKGENDTFNISNADADLISRSRSDTKTVEERLSSLKLSPKDADTDAPDDDNLTVDYDKIMKVIQLHPDQLPTIRETPKFSHQNFYLHLERYMGNRIDQMSFGKRLMYAEIITSTSTILEKNHSLLKTLPTGLTATASTQISGRGRGSNVWVSPPGSLMFSTVIWHPMDITHSAPVVFVQYLAAMAVVRGAKTYARGYDAMPLRLKWPNDVYAEVESKDAEKNFVKVAGILVNSSYSGSDYGLVVGVGVNVANAAPTTGLDLLAKKLGLPVFEPERLLARILTTFEELYTMFCSSGWGSELEDMYYEMWLHNDQIVTLETEGGLRARVKGVTRDWGLLVAEELGWEDRPTGHTISLQTDSNSFDFFRGLIKRKV